MAAPSPPPRQGPAPFLPLPRSLRDPVERLEWPALWLRYDSSSSHRVFVAGQFEFPSFACTPKWSRRGQCELTLLSRTRPPSAPPPRRTTCALATRASLRTASPTVRPYLFFRRHHHLLLAAKFNIRNVFLKKNTGGTGREGGESCRGKSKGSKR